MASNGTNKMLETITGAPTDLGNEARIWLVLVRDLGRDVHRGTGQWYTSSQKALEAATKLADTGRYAAVRVTYVDCWIPVV